MGSCAWLHHQRNEEHAVSTRRQHPKFKASCQAHTTHKKQCTVHVEEHATSLGDRRPVTWRFFPRFFQPRDGIRPEYPCIDTHPQVCDGVEKQNDQLRRVERRGVKLLCVMNWYGTQHTTPPTASHLGHIVTLTLPLPPIRQTLHNRHTSQHGVVDARRSLPERSVHVVAPLTTVDRVAVHDAGGQLTRPKPKRTKKPTSVKKENKKDCGSMRGPTRRHHTTPPPTHQTPSRHDGRSREKHEHRGSDLHHTAHGNSSVLGTHRGGKHYIGCGRWWHRSTASRHTRAHTHLDQGNPHAKEPLKHTNTTG